MLLKKRCAISLFGVFVGFSFPLEDAEIIIDRAAEPNDDEMMHSSTERNLLQCTEPRKLLQSGQVLSVGEEWMSWDTDQYASIRQEANGNLVVRRRSDHGTVLCESGVKGSSDGVPYVTKLYGDGNLITWSSPERIPPRVWKSRFTGDSSSTWFLAVDCDDRVSIYQDSVFGDILWTCPIPEYGRVDGISASRNEDPITTFCVVADAPYNIHEHKRLRKQMKKLDPECEFVAHLGDIRASLEFEDCVKETYTNVSKIMRKSPKPAFMLLGDNEYNDCKNYNQALGMWHDEFDDFHNKHWEHNFEVISQPDRVENLYFVHKQALFVMLNIVGGRMVDRDEWKYRLTRNFEWTKELIEIHVHGKWAKANVVVIMAHATDTPNHQEFFHSMRDYIEFDLKNSIPILYVNGDTHVWNEQSNYFDQWNWKRVTLSGNTVDKPLKVTVNARDETKTAEGAFSFQRFY